MVWKGRARIMSNLPALKEDAMGVQPYTGAQPQTGELLRAVLREVGNPNVDPARLREFLEIGERLEARSAKEAFARAMAELRPKLPVIKKNGLISYGVGKGSTPFAKWDDIHRACMPLLDAHGLSCSFSADLMGTNALKVTMTVKHTSGHEESGSLVVPWLDTGGSKSPAQAAASSFTLAQRQSFIKFFNILTEDRDDDGSGKGAAERITDEQANRIADILQECESREAGVTARFTKWMKAEKHTEVIAELFQGEQYDSVMAFLRTKMAKLGIK